MHVKTSATPDTCFCNNIIILLIWYGFLQQKRTQKRDKVEIKQKLINFWDVQGFPVPCVFPTYDKAQHKTYPAHVGKSLYV